MSDLRERHGEVRSAGLLLVVEESSERRAALLGGAERGARLLGALSQPRGGDVEALAATLATAAGMHGALEHVHGGAEELSVAAGRLAAWLGGPVRVVEIGADAARLILAAPDRAISAFEVPGAALVPADPIERQRRCDGVLALLERSDRSVIADLLGDLAEAPLRDRDDLRDQVRAAATADALRRLAELLDEERVDGMDLDGAPLLLIGSAASLIATGTLPIGVVAPLLPLGRTRLLLEPYGVFSALGSGTLDEAWVAAALPSLAGDLLLPGGDLFLLEGAPGDELLVSSAGGEEVIRHGALHQLALRTGESESVRLTRDGQSLEATLHGGIARAAIVFGAAPLVLTDIRSGSLSAAIASATRAAPIPAPIRLLPAASTSEEIQTGRHLLGDPVEGEIHFSESEPEGGGWELAVAAGLLAIGNASPETVLRARAVGVRGVILLRLSDGERDALSASLERRIAAAVATEPFGILIMTPRRPLEGGATRAIELLRTLHGRTVRFHADPAGLVVYGGSGPREGGDVLVVGGAYEGRYGSWEGLADPRADDPLGAVRLDGQLCAIPLGDLQRAIA